MTEQTLPAARPRRPVTALAQGIWLPIGVVLALILFFASTSDVFLSLRNLTAVSGQASTLLLACVGATFVVLMGSIDLSVGAVVLLVGAVTVTALNTFNLGVFAVFFGIAAGAAIGLVNGLIVAYGLIPSFVVTLGSLSVCTGLAWQLLQGRALRFDSASYEWLAIGQAIPYVPNIALAAILVWLLASVAGFRAKFGRYMYAIGGGEAVARSSGIPVRRYKITAFVISGAIAGLAGALAVARLGAAGPTLGSELLLNSLAAIVVGGTSLSGGIGGVHRTLLGVMIIALLDNGLNLLGVQQYSQMMVKGAVVIAAVLISQDRRKSAIVK